MSSIFQRANPAIQKVFQDAGSPQKVMCVPIDYAKRLSSDDPRADARGLPALTSFWSFF